MRSFRIGRFIVAIGRVDPLTLSARDGARFGRGTDGVLSVAWAPGVSVMHVAR